MNYLNKRFPKDIVYIILDYAKDVDNFDKVIREYDYKMRQITSYVPKNIFKDLDIYGRYLDHNEFLDFLLTYNNGMKYLRSTLGNKKLYYFG